MQQQLNSLAKLHEVENLNIYRVDVGGFKHATVPILAASLACSLRVHLSNVPEIADVRVICEILKQMGCEIQYHLENKSLIVDTTKAHFPEHLDAKLINSVHGTIYLIPAMTVRFGQSSIFHAGGCAIGSATKRPVHHILEALKILGSKVLKNADEETLSQDTSEFHCVETELPLTIDVLKHLNLMDNPSGPCVSGFTKALIIAGAGLGRPLKIINYYPKRDVLELVDFLKTAGYRVNLEKHFLEIGRRANLQNEVIEHRIPSDSIEIITHITLGALLKRPIELTNISVAKSQIDLKHEFEAFKQMGFVFDSKEDRLQVFPPKIINSIDIESTPFGLYSDSLPFFALIFLLAGNRSAMLIDRVWDGRFQYLIELKKLGYNFEIDVNSAIIHPWLCRTKDDQDNYTLHGQDLRSAAVLVLYSIVTKRRRRVLGLEHLERGYDSFFSKLVSVIQDRDLVETIFFGDSQNEI